MSSTRINVKIGLAAIAAIVLALAAMVCRQAVASDQSSPPAPVGPISAASAAHAQPFAPLPQPDAKVQRIAFGSCLNQRKPQPIWGAIKSVAPDLVVMLGDNVYGSTDADTIAPLAEAYATQSANAEFSAARAALPMLAIWDDHDFGRNDAGGNYPWKSEAARLFEAFWGAVPERPAPFAKTGGGLYQARTFGPTGARLQIVLLDTRYFRSPLKPKSATFPHWGRYEPDMDTAKTMLGDTQWRWLEATLAEPADLRILVSSIQVLAEGHGFERWGNLPAERERLLRLVRDATGRTILVSGDRHYGAFYEFALPPNPAVGATGPPGLAPGRTLVEMTASAMNMASGRPAEDARMAPLASEIVGIDNFGVADIDWRERRARLTLRGVDGRTVLTRDVEF